VDAVAMFLADEIAGRVLASPPSMADLLSGPYYETALDKLGEDRYDAGYEDGKTAGWDDGADATLERLAVAADALADRFRDLLAPVIEDVNSPVPEQDILDALRALEDIGRDL
jgi:hypothetical protein